MTLRRDILVVVHPFMTDHLHCGQDCTQGGVQAHVQWMLPLIVLAQETFRETALLHPGKHQRKGTNQTEGLVGMELNQFGMPSGLPLVHLHPASVVEPRGMSKVPASVRDRLSLTREGKLWWKVCLHPRLEQGGTLWMERSRDCGCCFSLSYRWKLTVPEPLLYNVLKKKTETGLIPKIFKKDTPDLLL